MRKPGRVVALAAAALAVAFLATDCARPATSEPLTVTYYYLPG